MRTNDFMCSRMMMRGSEKQEDAKPGQGISRAGYLPLGEKPLTACRDGTLYMPNPETGRFEKVAPKQ